MKLKRAEISRKKKTMGERAGANEISRNERLVMATFWKKLNGIKDQKRRYLWDSETVSCYLLIITHEGMMSANETSRTLHPNTHTFH